LRTTADTASKSSARLTVVCGSFGVPLVVRALAGTNAAASLLCYGAKPARGEPKHVKQSGLYLGDQFGQERLDTSKEGEFCIPSERQRVEDPRRSAQAAV
jgi:hypothetical protein